MQRFRVTDGEYHAIVKQLERALHEEALIVFAYLHGSFPERNEFSDIDVCAYLDVEADADIWEDELKLEDKLQKQVSFPVDVRLLNKAPLSFRYAVVKNGLRLVDKEEDRRADFEAATLSHYFDFLPFRRRYLKEVLSLEI